MLWESDFSVKNAVRDTSRTKAHRPGRRFYPGDGDGCPAWLLPVWVGR